MQAPVFHHKASKEFQIPVRDEFKYLQKVANTIEFIETPFVVWF